MNNNKRYPASFIASLRCPQCGSRGSLNVCRLHCSHCGIEHFQLGDIPCLFPGGTNHRLLWQHQAAALRNVALQGLASIEQSLSRYDLLPATRQRLVEMYNGSKHNTEAILELLQRNDVEIPADDQGGEFNAGDLSEYFDLLLRDWGWDNGDTPAGENLAAFQRIMDAITQLPSAPERILVIGAGAGRLSWDLHQSCQPEYTVVFDSNPLLLAVANTLVHERRPLSFSEFKNFPQINYPVSRVWTLTPPVDAQNARATWFPLGGNVWQLPFGSESFDLVITPWFIDVNGGDVRDLMGVISEQLIPGGHWINSGPLLFTRHLPVQLKYTAEEIKEFIALASFDLGFERVDNSGYLLSPMEARFRQEQVWTFSAQKHIRAPQTGSDRALAPDWLILHHLPIPAGEYPSNSSHPLIEAIVSMVDGHRSVNDISFDIAPQIPEGFPVKDVVVAIFGQILKENEDARSS